MSSETTPTSRKKPRKIWKSEPELRFPNFENQADWAEVRLVDVADKKVRWSFVGGPFGSNLKSSDYTEHGVRIIQLQNIGDGEFQNDYQIFTTKQKADELISCNIYPGDIILSKMGNPVGRACLIPDIHERYLMCSDGIRLVIDEEKNNKYYIFSLVNSKSFRKLVENTATGSTRKRIGLDHLRNLLLTTPGKKEQQKIADCLSSIDDRITAETQKLDTLKAHKKGLMQQLFPVEGESVPKRRFRKFKKQWGETVLSKFINLQSGYAFKSEYFSEKGEKLLIPKNFTKTGYAHFSDENTKYTTEEYDARYVCRKGDLLLLLTDLTPSCELLGRPLLLTESDGNVLLNQRIARVIVKKEINLRFLLYLFSTASFRKRIINTATGSTVRHSSNKIVLSTKIRIPEIPDEQQEVADCLSVLDEVIAAQTQKLNKLKYHKKGLMQQLFPSLDEAKR